MLGERDPFDFMLAKDLGKTLAEISAMEHGEYVQWRAYYRYQAASDPRTWR